MKWYSLATQKEVKGTLVFGHPITDLNKEQLQECVAFLSKKNYEDSQRHLKSIKLMGDLSRARSSR